VIWWPEGRPKLVEIRAEVADRAGNLAVSHAQVELDRDVVARSNPEAIRGREVDANPAIGNQYPTPPEKAARPNEYATPAGQRPQMVNSRLFDLEYHVDAVGPPRVGHVELWGTRDGGRTWTSFGLDNDNQSPMLVTVNEEGLYGLRVAVRDAAGSGSGKPQSGDLPDVWVGVDLTRPTARILSAERGTGDQAGQFIIRWEADDQMLAARPVSLYYSDTPGGPWSTIASGLENTGCYVWPVDVRLPELIYLRLDVRDEAGNVGSFEVPDGVALDPLHPAVRIQNVRPAVESAQRAASQTRLRLRSSQTQPLLELRLCARLEPHRTWMSVLGVSEPSSLS